MTSILNLKTGSGIIRRISQILATPYHNRRKKWGRGWAWDITNGQEIIREQYPELIHEMNLALVQGAPQTIGDLVTVAP